MTEQENLELQIATYDTNYRAGTPLISDVEFDKLVEELKQKFPNSILLKSGVIKQETKTSRKEKLPLPMYSLDKCKSTEEIKQWLKSNDISEDEMLIITPKYDGISLVTIESEDKAWTRGDGEVGQKSHNHFSKLNDKHCGVDIIAFGEAIMSKKNFVKYKDKFANPRNMVAGLFNRDEASQTLKDVDYIRYGSNINDLDKVEQLSVLNTINEVPVRFTKVPLKYLDELNLDIIYKEWSQDYQIDGLVIDINSAKVRKELGREENMNPKYARAIKLPEWSGSKDVVITGKVLNISKQGKLKGTVSFDGIELDGATITDATFYNAKFLIDFCLTEGRNIGVCRSGSVIPKIIKVEDINIPQKEQFKSDKEFESALNNVKSLVRKKIKEDEFQKLCDELTICPSCGEPMKWDETMTELICNNLNCKEKKIAKLVHFFSTLEFEDFGEPSIRKIYDAGYETILSILSLKIDDVIKIDGFGFSSAHKLVSQFEKLKEVGVPFAKILHALDLNEGKIGEKTIQLILDNIPEFLMSDFRDITVSSLLHINGIAEITARAFLDGVLKFFEYHNDLPIEISYIQTPKQKVVGNKYNGMKICFTGCRPTKEQEGEIKSQGGEIVSGVSNKTTHLVVKDINSTSSKTDKAKSLGIVIIELNKFFE